MAFARPASVGAGATPYGAETRLANATVAPKPQREHMLPSVEWWIGLLQIIGIDIILSGDNALVIALACRSLPEKQRRIGVWLGVGAAVVLRIAMAVAIVYVLMVPLVRAVGALLLFWIAIKLLIPEPEGEAHEGRVAAGSSLWSAVRIVAVADAVMSLDNVISVAAAAKGHVELLAIGIAISIPLIFVGSRIMLWMLDRYPILITAGAALLGWIAGELMVSDPVIAGWLGAAARQLYYPAAVAGAVVVVIIGHVLARRAAGRQMAGRR